MLPLMGKKVELCGCGAGPSKSRLWENRKPGPGKLIARKWSSSTTHPFPSKKMKRVRSMANVASQNRKQ
jgi:hypothetical protein